MKISNRDWVQLSAFLDQELSPAEMEKLQRRIKADPHLQAALEDLQSVRQVLRQTPWIKLPRDFTLTPSLVGIKFRPKRQVYQNYRLAAVLASFLLVGVLLFDYGIILRPGAFAPAMAPLADEMMMEKAVEQPLEEAAEEPALLAAEAESDQAETGEYQSELAATQPVEIAAAPAAEGLAEEAQVPTATLEAFPTQEAEIAGEVRSGTDEETQTGDSTAEEIQEAQLAPSPEAETLDWAADQEQLPPREPSRPALPTLRILEVLLIIGVVGFGAAAWISRRKYLR